MSSTASGPDHRPDNLIDAVVIGGGAAGLSGALMLARSRRSVVVVDSGDPHCHGFEVRDEAIGVLGVAPASIHQLWLFRQLTDDLVYLSQGADLDGDTCARLAGRGVTVVKTPVARVEADDSGITGVRLVDGQVVRRRVLAVATTMVARTDGLDGLGLPMADLPNGMGRHLASGMAGTTEVPGVWVAGNATELHAQVGGSAAAGALAGSHINAHLAAADTAAAVHVGGRLSGHAS